MIRAHWARKPVGCRYTSLQAAIKPVTGPRNSLPYMP
jgi:hypothetical protein